MSDTLTAAEATSLRHRAKQAALRVAGQHLALAKVLYETYYATIVKSGEHVEVVHHWGFESWDDYVEREIDLHYQTAHAYRRVWEIFEVDLAGVKKKPYPQGITKLKALSRIELTAKNVNGWLMKASNVSCCKLEHMVSGNGHHKTLSVSLSSESAKSSVESNLEFAKKHFGVKTRGDALVRLCAAGTKTLRLEASKKKRAAS